MINLDQGGWEMLLALDVGESIGGVPVACCMMKRAEAGQQGGAAAVTEQQKLAFHSRN